MTISDCFVLCKENYKNYIGETIGNFHIRYCYHLGSFRLKQEDKSNFAKHLLTKDTI